MEFEKILQEWAVMFGRRSIQDFMKFAREYHLSMPQINVLMRLYYSGSSTILHLRADFAGSRAAASQMIDQLVQNGWVERSEAPDDRRVKTVSLTPEGRALVERGIAARRKWLGDLAVAFTPEQRVEIERVLRMIINQAVVLEQSQPPHHPAGEA